VFRSANDGNTWTNISSGLTTFNINPLAVDSTGVLFAGSNGSGVFRSTTSTMGTTILLSAGWSLVSVPRIPSNFAASVLFPNAVGSLFGFNMVSGYIPLSTLANGPGYWARHLTATSTTITGSSLNSVSASVSSAGWVLWGSLSSTVPLSSLTSNPPGAIVPGSVYTFDGTSYILASSFEPGRGYWVRVNQACTLFLQQ
jgi:hypothetical protein